MKVEKKKMKVEKKKMKVEKKKMGLAEAGKNALDAWANLTPLFCKKEVNGMEMVKGLTALIYLQKLLAQIKGAILKQWPDFAEIAKEIEETCYEH